MQIIVKTKSYHYKNKVEPTKKKSSPSKYCSKRRVKRTIIFYCSAHNNININDFIWKNEPEQIFVGNIHENEILAIGNL
jgi:hypothetical protein